MFREEDIVKPETPEEVRGGALHAYPIGRRFGGSIEANSVEDAEEQISTGMMRMPGKYKAKIKSAVEETWNERSPVEIGVDGRRVVPTNRDPQ